MSAKPDYVVILAIIALAGLGWYAAKTSTDNPIIPIAIAGIITLASLNYVKVIKDNGAATG